MERLSIDYVSDLHLAFYIKATNAGFNEEDIVKLIEEKILSKKKGDVLVIAGDLSEFINSNIYFLSECAKHYDKVFYVAGNHEHYLSWIISSQMKKKYLVSDNKINDIIYRLSSNDKIIFLDTSNHTNHGVYNYKGFTIAGDTFWYYPKNIADWIFYLYYSNDSRMIKSKCEGKICRIKRLHKESMKWYDSLEDNIDLIITHVPPFHNPDSKKDKNSCYYNPVEKIKATTWIYGHDHYKASFHKDGCRFLSNPWGYISKDFNIENVVIEK